MIGALKMFWNFEIDALRPLLDLCALITEGWADETYAPDIVDQEVLKFLRRPDALGPLQKGGRNKLCTPCRTMYCDHMLNQCRSHAHHMLTSDGHMFIM